MKIPLILLIVLLLSSSAICQENSSVCTITVEPEPTYQIAELSKSRTSWLMRGDSQQIMEELVGLNIETTKETYVLGEPITVTAKLTNISSKSVALFKSDNFLHLWLSRDGNHFWRFVDEEIVDSKPKKEMLGSGNSWTFHKTLLRGVLSRDDVWAREIFLLPAAGAFYLRATCEGSEDIKIVSNVIKVNVIAPEGVDARVWQMLQDKDAATYQDYTHFLKYNLPRREDAKSRKEILEKLNRIVEAYPESTYASILRDALIRHFEGRAKGRFGPPLSEEEKVWYESLRSRN